MNVLLLALLLVLSLKLICSDISPTAKSLFTTTILETGQLKFLANLFLSKEEIDNIIKANSYKEMASEVDKSLINVPNVDKEAKTKTTKDDKGYRIEEISGTTFYAKALIIDDPARVSLATIYPWQEYGKELKEICDEHGGHCAVNGGLYRSTLNKGGSPIGVVVSNNEIQYNSPEGITGLYIIGFDASNILRIINIDGMNRFQTEDLIKKEKIRDAVVFQEEKGDKNNHFVKIIINGEERPLDGMGSGANPRTVVGQKADGTVIFLVTDGRGRDGHLGATLKDLIRIMKSYDVVNAANLDGGSSSSMYVDGVYEMTSVTLYSANSSWRLPLGFIVK